MANITGIPRCMTGSNAGLDLIAVQAPTSAAAKVLSDLIDGIDIQSMAACEAEVPILDAPDLNTPRLSMMKKCVGDLFDVSAFEVIVYHDPDYDMSVLLGAKGTYVRHHQINRDWPLVDPEGSQTGDSLPDVPANWSGLGVISKVDLMPNEEANELAMSTLELQYLEGLTHTEMSHSGGA